MALSALIAVAGHEVWARGHQPQGTPQSQSTSNPNQAATASGRGGQRGPGSSFPGGRGPDQQPPNAAEIGMQWDWWHDPDVKKEIGLRLDQTKRIDDFYSSRVKDIDPVAQEYQKEREVLDKMFAERLVDSSILDHELTKVYTLRMEVNKSRILMLYRIAKALDAEQYAKLQAILNRRIKDYEAHRGGRTGGEGPMPHGLR
jgi:Spy/CpxP family protein refolding chaperone